MGFTGKSTSSCIFPVSSQRHPTWSPAAKSGVGRSLSSQSHLAFTVGRGIINEVYYPALDQAAIRDFGFIATGPSGYFCEESKDCFADIQLRHPGVPSYLAHNSCTHGRIRLRKEIIVDPDRDVLLQRVKLIAKQGSLADFRLFCLLSPRLQDQGRDNSGWTGVSRKTEMLFAQSGEICLALASSAAWLARSVSYAGPSDAWHDLRENGRMTRYSERADHGSISLSAEIDLAGCNGEFVIALGFSRTADGAGLNAVLSLNRPFETIRDEYEQHWQSWQEQLIGFDDVSAERCHAADQQRIRPDRSRPRVDNAREPDHANLFRQSMMVLQTHRSCHFAGAGVASLSIPWGEMQGDDSRGYHLVWSRDLVEQAIGLLAGGASYEVAATLDYLRATQKPQGGWPKNMCLDGHPFSQGVQLDEAALPILLVYLAHREGTLKDSQIQSFWPMVRDAAAFIIRSGPETGQDRWENTPGLSPYTLATEIAALLIASRLAEHVGEPALAECFQSTADLWNDSIEPWCYVKNTPLAKCAGVDGYYVRIAPSPGMLTIRRREEKPRMKQAHDLPAEEVVSADALALVRFGLRSPDDPKIVNTVKVIDLMTRRDLPAGPCWRRYNGDYYGEYADGSSFHGEDDKRGVGRCWPLLTGERGHYEIAAGDFEGASEMLQAMHGFASQIGLLPEQVWDSDDIPTHDLYCGRPSGSAMPLVWTHAEYVRLLRSIHDRRVFDRPSDTWERYVERSTRSERSLWRFDHQSDWLFAKRKLRIEVMAPAIVRYSMDNWATMRDVETHDIGLGFQFVDLPTASMQVGSILRFTFRWPRAGNRWEGRDFELEVIEAPSADEKKSRTVARTSSPGKNLRSLK